jgi:hypothetical protein
MSNTFRLKHLKEITEDAIHQYSENHHCAAWLLNVEYKVLDIITNNKEETKYFKEYQVNAMRDLIRDGYWIRLDESNLQDVKVIMYRLDKQ